MPQAKKQSRFSKLGSSIKTPKGRILVTVLAFALVGGGIMVFRSFAATTTTVQSFSVNAKTIGCVSGPCGQVVAEAGKNGLNVLKMGSGVTYTNSFTLQPGKYQVCTTAKADRGSYGWARITIGFLGNASVISGPITSGTNKDTINYPTYGVYEQRCTGTLTVKSTFNGQVNPSSNADPMTLSVIAVNQIIDTPAPTTPAPTK